MKETKVIMIEMIISGIANQRYSGYSN